jgi:hypothetical protein
MVFFSLSSLFSLSDQLPKQSLFFAYADFLPADNREAPMATVWRGNNIRW